ncbi:ATP synthase, subunit beta (ATP synthase F0 sector subunit b) [Desulfonema limicola]|uniref:ATP synthase subunit b n=1 Tax=Desulfonema limicola TaxID=45656 RepID=A0A975B3L9_9BACT|nr:ATP synthase F0 subunit B [Desulfonema limicola]QTA78168.1 ATP synthase, subunit beta (ATP synthase F0 sector subunit b) [Desulfonema limicola]
MKIPRNLSFLSYIIIGILCIFFCGQAAFASEGGGDNWRHTYDLGMKWLNFAILAFVIYKFGKAPLMNFLHGQKNKLSVEIGEIEKDKSRINEKLKEIQAVLDKGEAHYAELKERIINQGLKSKADIIEQAKSHSQILIEASKQKVDNEILKAKRNFKAELIDAAIAIASEKLPTQITDDDNQKFIDNYLAGTAK